MCKFGLEITSVLSGTICPVQVAQYARYIQPIPTIIHTFEKNDTSVQKGSSILQILPLWFF